MNLSGSGHTLSDVALDITVECMDDRGIRHEIDTVLGYAASDPFAVAMTFVTADGNLVWTFGRDLLIRAREAPAGEGDVHVAPAIGLSGRAMVSIELSSPDGHLVLLARCRGHRRLPRPHRRRGRARHRVRRLRRRHAHQPAPRFLRPAPGWRGSTPASAGRPSSRAARRRRCRPG